MKVKPLENYKLFATSFVLDNNVVYEATWATNQPDWQSERKIFVGDAPSMLLRAGEYVIVESDLPQDIHAIKRLLREWLRAVDIPPSSTNSQKDGCITLTDDRMRQIIESTNKLLHTLIES